MRGILLETRVDVPLLDIRPGVVHLPDEVQKLRTRVDVLPLEILACVCGRKAWFQNSRAMSLDDLALIPMSYLQICNGMR